MTWEFIWIIILVLGALAAFIWEKWPVDLTAMGIFALVMGTAMFTESPIWPSVESLLGVFSNPAALTIAGMFILSAALERCGVIEGLARALSRYGSIPYPLFLGLLVAGVAFFSAFMNNTVVVVVLLPVVTALAKEHHYAPSKFLIPLSYASIFGGCCTAIGTSTNILASGLLVTAGYEAFGMFEFTRVGLPLALLGTFYLMAFGHLWLPENHLKGARAQSTVEKNDGGIVQKPVSRSHRWGVIAIFIGVISLSAMEPFPMVGVVGLGIVLLCALRLMRLEEVYAAIDGRTMVLLYGTLALGLAMDQTGLAHSVAAFCSQFLQSTVPGAYLPFCLLIGIYIGTLLLTELLSNNATILLMGPIALELAETAQVSPHPLMMAACLAASGGFMIPTGYQTHMYVYGAGRYRFLDFIRIGWPLDIIYAVGSCIMIPLAFPF
jgi:di/tricarboxylate transporter